MGLFGKRKPAATQSSAGKLQPPDALAEEARLRYGSADFVGAAELYAEAIDKLHTMYAVGGCRFRSPSTADQPILDGMVQSVGAATAAAQGAAVKGFVQQATYYLSDIARSLSGSGQDTRALIEASSRLEAALG